MKTLFLPRSDHVDRLAIRDRPEHFARADHNGEERLAQGLSLSDLGEAPPRRHRVGTAKDDHGGGDLEISVKIPLPVDSRLDPGFGVGVEEQRLVAVLGSRSSTRTAMALSFVLWLMNIAVTGAPLGRSVSSRDVQR